MGSHGDVELRRAGELVVGIGCVRKGTVFAVLLVETGNYCRCMECFAGFLGVKASL